jgi:hypothetical protein
MIIRKTSIPCAPSAIRTPISPDAPRDRPREHAVDADDGEHNCKRREGEREYHRRALRTEGPQYTNV